MRAPLIAASLLLGSQASGQAFYSGLAAPVTADDLAAMQALIPVPASITPPTETVAGATGTPGTYRPGNAVQPRITRSVPFTTDATGTAAVTWPTLPAVPLVFPEPNVASGAAQAPICAPVTGTVTTTGVTIKCWTTQSVTVSLLGAVVAPVSAAAAGVTGQVLAIPAS